MYIMTAANEIIVDAAVVVLLLQLHGIYVLKEEQKLDSMENIFWLYSRLALARV